MSLSQRAVARIVQPFTGSTSNSRPLSTPQLQNPPYCGAYFAGLAAPEPGYEIRRRSSGCIDISASIAGFDRIEPFLRNEPAVWDAIIASNYVGPVRMIQRLLPAMIERRQRAKIITVASDAGLVGSSGETFYAGSKGAVIAFTKSLARELARHDINCNCVAPGPTETPLLTVAMDEKLRDALTRNCYRSCELKARAALVMRG